MKVQLQKYSKKEILISVAKYLSCFASFYLLARANINGTIFPFGFGLLFALVWCNQNPFVIAPIYLGAMILADFSFVCFLASLFCVVVMLISYIISHKLKRPIKPFLLPILGGVSQGLALFFKFSSSQLYVETSVEFLIGIVFLIVCQTIFQAISVRGVYAKFTLTEYICAGIFVASFFNGLESVNLFGFSLSKMLGVLLILFFSYVFDGKTALLFSAIIGVGTLMPSKDYSLLCLFSILGLVTCMFKTNQKAYQIVAVLIVDALFCFGFNDGVSFTYLSILPTIIACVVFVLIPSKLLLKIKNYFSLDENRLAMRNIVERNKLALSKRFMELSDVFNEMNKVFRATLSGGATKEQAKVLLSQELKDKVCKDCANYAKCHRTNQIATEDYFETMFMSAFDKEKVSPFDIPQGLTRTCDKASAIISTVNQLSEQYKRYAGAMNSIDASKVLIAEQLYGLSGILKTLGKEVGERETYNLNLENKVQSELVFNNVICSDVVVGEKFGIVASASAVVRCDTLAVKKIENVFSKLCKCQMSVATLDNAEISGWKVLSLVQSPKFEVVFGYATLCKTGNEQNGDSYSLTKLDTGKFLLALCDGMGSGKKAEKASNLAMGLVENFYKAGFDNDIILSSVNKLLSLGSDDVFSALDLCVIDLNDATCDIIKLGAPSGYIKKKNGTEIVESGSLPLGILGQVTPCIKTVALSDGDYIVLCTDGVSDSFFGEDDLKNFIQSSTQTNPQKLADSIMQTAVQNCKGVALDDMTCICARLVKRN